MTDSDSRKPGNSPYEVLVNYDIGPDTSMSIIRNAFLKSMAMNWTPEIRKAFEKVRFVSKRLFFEFFLSQIEGEVVTARLLAEKLKSLTLEVEPPDVSPLLTPDTGELRKMAWHFEQVDFIDVTVEYLVDIRPPEQDWTKFLPFDS